MNINDKSRELCHILTQNSLHETGVAKGSHRLTATMLREKLLQLSPLPGA